jgi:ankyrin repeat protein
MTNFDFDFFFFFSNGRKRKKKIRTLKKGKKKMSKKFTTTKEKRIQDALTVKVLKEGWLNKRGGSVKSWKKRYFVMRENKCYYYKSELTQKKAMRGMQPMGEINFNVVASCDEVTPKDIKGEKKSMFYFKLTVSTGRGFYLIATHSQQSKDEWMEAIRAALKLYAADREKWDAVEQGKYDPFSDKAKTRTATLTYNSVQDQEQDQADAAAAAAASSPSSPSAPVAAASADVASPAADEVPVAVSFEDDYVVGDDDDAEFELPAELYDAESLDTDMNQMAIAQELYTAVRARRYPAIKALLGLNALVTWNNQDEGGKTALHLAAERGDRTALTMLLSATTIPVQAIVCQMGWTVLHYASFNGNLACVEQLLQLDGDASAKLVAAADNEDRVPAYLAACAGRMHCLKALMRRWPSGAADLPSGMNALHMDTAIGDVEAARKLVGAGEHTADCLDHSSKTPLHFAAAGGHVAMCRYLLQEAGADWASTDNRNKQPIHFAAGLGHVDCVEALLAASPKAAKARDEARFTPLHMAAMHGHTDAVELLLKQRDAKIDGAGRGGYTPLLLATHSGYADCARTLLVSGADVHAPNSVGTTPLHEAARRGYLDLIALLLELGADASRVDTHGRTPLHAAVHSGCAQCIDALIAAGADCNAATGAGCTPVSIAVDLGSEHIVRSLLDAGAAADTVVRGATPLHRAVEQNDAKVARCLVDHGHPVNVTDSAGATPLMLAARVGSLSLTKYLIKNGAVVHPDDDGSGGDQKPLETRAWTALHEAVDVASSSEQGSSCDIVELLLDRFDARHVDARAPNNSTPLHIAAARGNISCARLLVASKADLDARNDAGNAPLHLAARNKHLDLVLYLVSNAASLSPSASASLDQFLEILAGESSEQPDEPDKPARIDEAFDEPDFLKAPSDDEDDYSTDSDDDDSDDDDDDDANAGAGPPSTAVPPSDGVPSGPPPPVAPRQQPPAAEAEPPKKSQQEMQMNARQYIQRAQQLLSKEQYVYFQGMLRDYKTKQLEINALMEKVLDLFSAPDRRDLLSDFVQFIPSRYKENYRLMIKERE